MKTTINPPMHLPDTVQERMAEGATLLTALREWRGLTACELSERADVQLVILMMAERGADLLPDEAYALAGVLGVDPELLAGQVTSAIDIQSALKAPMGKRSSDPHEGVDRQQQAEKGAWR